MIVKRNSIFDETFDSLIDSFFYNFPKEMKPPYQQKIEVDDKGSASAVVTQVALAGFKKEDVKVWYEDKVLFIEGDNTKNTDVLEKFRSSFKWKLPTSDRMALKETVVSFENGLLVVRIPVKVPIKDKTFLFGI